MQLMGTSGVLVGREAQVEALQEFLHDGPARRPPVMLVAGEAGVGKTALVDHVLVNVGMPVRRGWAAGRKSAGRGAGPGAHARRQQPAHAFPRAG